MAKKYEELRHNSRKNDDNYSNNNNNAKITTQTAAQVAADIIDSISIPSFSFPLKKETQTANGITTYIYENNATFPALYNFLAEILHSEIPIEIGAVKLGPGEITVNKEKKNEADTALKASVKELRELVHAKRSQATSR